MNAEERAANSAAYIDNFATSWETDWGPIVAGLMERTGLTRIETLLMLIKHDAIRWRCATEEMVSNQNRMLPMWERLQAYMEEEQRNEKPWEQEEGGK